MLELTPIQLLKYEYRNDGQIDVLVPRFKNQFFQNLMPKRRSPYIKANLDEIGTAAWKLIDGKRKVNEIVKLLNEEVQKIDASAEQIEQRLCTFIQQLNVNKFITFIEFMEK